MSVCNKLSYFLLILFASLYQSVALAEGSTLQDRFTGNSSTSMSSMLDSFVGNYMGVEQLGNYLISLMVAITLAMIIAFHPQTFGKKEDLNEIEAPKTLILYGMIGSLVGATVADYVPELGFIFFGLGGLMRFRTNTGTSIQTGRLILVALIGLCCGLKMLYIAVISTVVAWIIIYFLERRTLYHIEIKGIDEQNFSESIVAYRHALQKQKCNIIMEKKNSSKHKVSFIFSSPAKLRHEGIEDFLNQTIAPDSRGSIDWSVGYK
ncbi:MAG: MgtC/SapB family protein [Cyanobacteria bacterium P01_G01_bin.67]